MRALASRQSLRLLLGNAGVYALQRGTARRSVHDGDKQGNKTSNTSWQHIGSGRKREEEKGKDGTRAQRTREASDRLRQLFRDDATRNEWLQRPGSYLAGNEVSSSENKTLVLPNITTSANEEEVVAANVSGVDKDSPTQPPAALQPALSAVGARRVSEVEVLEQELLDDDAGYYPPLAVTATTTATTTSETSVGVAAGQEEEEHKGIADAAAARTTQTRYVPGQQIIPPGLTRYRVDVQYQGCDFDGWCKGTQRQMLRRGQLVKEAVSMTETDTDRNYNNNTTRPQAKAVLEEALAVALDVPAVSVVAAVTPETGVSVRRLTCHVDLPSEIEMQPRTVLQRATMWLQKRQHPLAVLSCAPCRNQDFHARHSGVRRVYCYRILNRVAPPLFDAGLQWHVDRHLDVARMRRFAAAMQGTRDFGYFADPKMANALRRAALSRPGRTTAAYLDEHAPLTSKEVGAPKVTFEKGLTNLQRAAAMPTFNEYGQRVVSYDAKPAQYYKASTNLPTVRTVDKIEVVRQEDEVLIWFVGQSFLRHQIRNMVSVLKASGHGLWDELELQHAFATGFTVSRKRFARERLPPAPAHGLTLWDVEYPAQYRDDFVAFVDSGPFEEVDLVHTA